MRTIQEYRFDPEGRINRVDFFAENQKEFDDWVGRERRPPSPPPPPRAG